MLRYATLAVFALSLTGSIFKQRGASKSDHTTAQKSALPAVDTTPPAAHEIRLDGALLQVHFCGDTLPLKDPAVARRYHNALKHYVFPDFKHYKKKVSADLNTIGQILKNYKIPTDFRYVPVVESHFYADAISPRGATGYWQFMPETAKALGLRVDDEVDERTDLVKSTHAAAKYLKWLYGQLGDWTLVAVAYNIGPGRLIKHMDKQKKNDFYQLRLNSETSRYIYKLVAVKEWFNKPDRCEVWMEDGFLAQVSEFYKHHGVFHETITEKLALVNPSVR